MKPPKTHTHGGKRKGSGRKKRDTLPIFLNLKPETIDKIRAEAVKPKTMGQVVDERFK